MKKALLPILIILFLLVCIESVYIINIQSDNKNLKEQLSRNENIKKNDEYAIDIDYKKCIEKDYSTAGMNNCAYKAQEEWGREIQKNSKKLRKILDKDKLNLFNEAQTSWQNYYNKEKEFILKTIFELDGTIHTNYAAGDLYEIVKRRALDIKGHIFEIEN